jgi:TetR/AcrR family transcriptional regulator, transcriptional repressor for nem operon
MPYHKHHKHRTYERILQSARRLFVTQGYAATSIDEIMLDCGLTRGGFYAHFRSKSQLYREAMRDADHALIGDESELQALLDDWMQAAGATFLARDIASQQQDVRAAYSHAFRRLCQRLGCATHGMASDEQIIAAAAAIVGAAAVLNTTDDAELKQRILGACHRQVPVFLAEQSTRSPHFFWAPALGDELDGSVP